MGEQEAAGRGPGEWGTHNSAKRCCRLSAGRLLILVAAVDEAIFSIASFFLRKNGGKVPRPKGAKEHDVAGVREVSGMAPESGRRCIRFRVRVWSTVQHVSSDGGDRKQTANPGNKSSRWKVAWSYYAVGCMTCNCSGNEKTLPRSCPYSRKVCSYQVKDARAQGPWLLHPDIGILRVKTSLTSHLAEHRPPI